MPVLKCKLCGGDLKIGEKERIATCDYCGSTMTIPRLSDEQQVNLYNRANHYRQNGDFDRAAKVYEKILEEDSSEAEAYWGLLLCRHGIEYVVDPHTQKRKPTCHRAQYQSILLDPDYKQTLQHSNGYTKILYEQEAIQIDQIQKEILEISKKEEPFDVFLCYKESEENGNRTKDSVIAQEIYYELTEKGYKVFFSRITLEDKLGYEYEPYIFAALNSSHVLIAIGTKLEYFEATWVKNEWSRYLKLMQQGTKRLLVPAYRDMDPYDLPEEFSNLQALDMGKIGFMQDLIRGIEKVLNGASEVRTNHRDITEGTFSASVDSLLKRACFFIEDGDFEAAVTYFNSVLDRNPEESRAYWGLVLCENNYKTEEQLIQQFNGNLESSRNFQRAVQFAKDKEKMKYLQIKEKLIDRYLEICIRTEKEILERRERIHILKEKITLYKEEIEGLKRQRKEFKEHIIAEKYELEEKLNILKTRKNALVKEHCETPSIFYKKKKIILAEITELYPLIDETRVQFDQKSIEIKKKLEAGQEEIDKKIQIKEQVIRDATQELSRLVDDIQSLQKDIKYNQCKVSLQNLGKYVPAEGFMEEET